MQNKSKSSDFPESPINPAGKKHQGHRQRHIEIGVGASEYRLVHYKPIRSPMPSANGANPGNQPNPITKQNENENTGKKPKRPLNQVVPDNALQEIMQAFDHPFPEVLRPIRDFFHIAGGQLRKNDQT